MPICTHPSSPYESEYQPKSEFNGFKWCKTCRQRSLKQKKSSYGRSNSNAVKVAKKENLEIGVLPQFLMEGHQEMYEQWLKNLVNEVRNETSQDSNS